jgi:CheY-like chemotaxis protein
MHCSSGGRWVVRLLSVLFVFTTAQSTSAYAQRTESAQTVRAKAVLQATVTTQSSIPLGGVLVSVLRDGTEVVNGVTDGDGKVKFDQLEPGTYSIAVASQGFDALTAEDGVKAVEILLRGDRKIDMMLVDLHAPGSSGVALPGARRPTPRARGWSRAPRSA